MNTPMAKKEYAETLPTLPVGEDPLQMTEQNKNTSAPQNEHKAAPDKKRPKRKRIPKWKATALDFRSYFSSVYPPAKPLRRVADYWGLSLHATIIQNTWKKQMAN